MRGLKQAAESGSFAISKEGAEAYVKAIEDAQKELRQLDKYNVQLSQETKLGTSPDAQAMSRYNAESANGGAGTTGIVPALNQLKMALEDAKLAMKKAIENYDQVDGSAASGLNRY
ncbi:hypothetical protein GCM10010492_27140 [Saccharothrix mutabilis subsp. mutabilis]|uniref:Uncharacterized protein n=1 Tax=Saccharothrix mutabilis subsp. mutabilis TaxID=66855 RepID=A0ABN0TQ93_9PSEU